MKTILNDRSFLQLSSKEILTNVSQGNYLPRFFFLQEFSLSRVDLNSFYFRDEDINIEAEIIKGSFSFSWLREDKLRTVTAVDEKGLVIPFERFLNHFNICISSQNLFKTSKYLSRLFRPVRYGAFYKELTIHTNNNHPGKQTDGISLVSVELARSLGWTNVEAGMSAQFTLFFKEGLVKGHCIISDRIVHDVIVYGDENIKKELSFGNGLQYLSLEPLKLGKTLRMDIQSLVNLWPLLGAEQYFSWGHKGIEQFKKNLMDGRLNEWLDNFEEYNNNGIENEEWTLRKAILKGIDYRNYPGLLRLAWSNFRSSIKTYSTDRKGEAIFRLPVPSGCRSYLRVDLREHDEHGNFNSRIKSGSAVLDNHGNLWISAEEMERFTSFTGGSDQDDSIAIIPLENSNALLYRNPNAIGEYVISSMEYINIDITHTNKLVGTLNLPTIKIKKESNKPLQVSENKLFNNFLLSLDAKQNKCIEFSRENLLRCFVKISSNQANIGVVANAEMIRSSIALNNDPLRKRMIKEFSWNLERVIDSTIKDGVHCYEDMENVAAMYNYIVENNFNVPRCLKNRIPDHLRSFIKSSQKHQLDELLEAIRLLIDKADIDILGSGTVSRNNRISGIIDQCQVPLIRLGLSAIGSCYEDLGISLLKYYNKEMAILLENTKDLPDKEVLRLEGIKEIQKDLLFQLSRFSKQERYQIINVIAYNIYKSQSFVHDSILWIKDLDGLKGTAEDMIGLINNDSKEGYILRSESRTLKVNDVDETPKAIRVWSSNELSAALFKDVSELVIQSREVVLGDTKLRLGDEVVVVDGSYKIQSIVQARSRKSNGRVLKNSLIIYCHQ